MIFSLVLGLAAWAAMLSMRMSPATDLARLQGAGPEGLAVTVSERSAADLYAAACASCHQNRGEGRFPVFPPLSGSPWVNGDPDRLIALTLRGLSGPIVVNGVEYSGLMPGFAHLSDREVARVLNHVRSAWGNNGGPLREADVAAVRARTADRRVPWTAAELQAAGEVRP